jgi:hypothetical protein
MQNLTTTQRLALFETAQETFGFLIANRSAAIWAENKSESPDKVKIAAWMQERINFQDKQDTLSFDDDEGIQAILNKYSNAVRENMGSPAEANSQIGLMTA